MAFLFLNTISLPNRFLFASLKKGSIVWKKPQALNPVLSFSVQLFNIMCIFKTFEAIATVLVLFFKLPKLMVMKKISL